MSEADQRTEELGVDISPRGEKGIAFKKVLQEGSGELALAGNEIHIHYTGRVLNSGEEFDSSRDFKKPFTFKLGAGQYIYLSSSLQL